MHMVSCTCVINMHRLYVLISTDELTVVECECL